uniref:Uncharacterized protein n=1 Tax=Rhizophora mucronata TaxID=61149 RepID=A0A2P2NGG5_RHIMU
MTLDNMNMIHCGGNPEHLVPIHCVTCFEKF